MRLTQHSARDFADALAALLPPGAAWRWPAGGFGDQLLVASGAELARIDAATQEVLDRAIELHHPLVDSWHISRYREVAGAALGDVAEEFPRQACVIGSHIGDRLWSAAAPATTFPVALLEVDHLIGPARIGSHIGDGLWGHRSRYILRVRYYRSVVDPAPIWSALSEFKQAHVALWFEDITGVGGIYYAAD